MTLAVFDYLLDIVRRVRTVPTDDFAAWKEVESVSEMIFHRNDGVGFEVTKAATDFKIISAVTQ